jgi:CubicO group peptidase (beta-lactamase class C family)
MKNTYFVLISTFIACGVTLTIGAGAQESEGNYQPGALAKSLQPFIDNHTLAGAVMVVASKDKVLATETVGSADIAAKKPMQADDLFWIASMTKAMTSTALMMLVDEGKLRLNDPVEKYLPQFRNQMVVVEQDGEHRLLKKPSHPITVKEMITHTSGLPGNSPLGWPLDGHPLLERALVLGLSPLEFEPSSKFEYGNGGFETAGHIIEVVSGVPYAKFLQDRLFGPLGMKDTTFWPSKQQQKRLAKSYDLNADHTDLVEIALPLTYPLNDKNRTPNPAGGLFSTAEDVSLFCRMILNGGTYEGHKYLSEAAVKEMTTTQTGDLQPWGDSGNGFGYGWVTSCKDSGPAMRLSPTPFGHSGAFRTDMWIDPQNQLVMVIMLQRGSMGDGSIFNNPFRKAAEDAFGKSSKH